MTQEDKAKAYDDAIKRAKAMIKVAEKEEAYKSAITIFPELKESEDEKIRKDIIWCLKHSGLKESSPINPHVTTTTKDAIAWLEKQGEPNPYSGTSFKYNGHTWGMCARDNGVEILVDGELKAFLSSEESFVYPIHPQPDLAPKSAIEAIKEEKVDNSNKIEPKDYSSIDPHFFKSIDNIEPNFKVGDWITIKE